MTRREKLVKKIDRTILWWWISVGGTSSLAIGIYATKVPWPALIIPLSLLIDVTINYNRHKTQLYTLCLLGKQNEPADNAEEDA